MPASTSLQSGREQGPEPEGGTRLGSQLAGLTWGCVLLLPDLGPLTCELGAGLQSAKLGSLDRHHRHHLESC